MFKSLFRWELLKFFADKLRPLVCYYYPVCHTWQNGAWTFFTTSFDVKLIETVDFEKISVVPDGGQVWLPVEFRKVPADFSPCSLQCVEADERLFWLPVVVCVTGFTSENLVLQFLAQMRPINDLSYPPKCDHLHKNIPDPVFSHTTREGEVVRETLTKYIQINSPDNYWQCTLLLVNTKWTI